MIYIFLNRKLNKTKCFLSIEDYKKSLELYLKILYNKIIWANYSMRYSNKLIF